MPKYYVDDGEKNVIIDAEDPVKACMVCWQRKFYPSITCGGHFWVSERGVGQHPEDTTVECDRVIQLLTDLEKGS